MVQYGSCTEPLQDVELQTATRQREVSANFTWDGQQTSTRQMQEFSFE